VSIALGVIVTIAVAAWLWRSREAQVTPDLTGANVLLVTIDTLRADRLATYGGQSGLTPTLDSLATNGVRFTHAWSHAPTTLPSHASILTGLLPPNHGVRNNGSYRLGPGPATLGEQLKASGYRTGAFVGAFVLDTRFGLNRGFDEYDDRYSSGVATVSFHFTERPADQVLRAATDWILHPTNGERRPWFAWVHLFDPHAPYQAPAEFARGRSPYDAEVAWTDAALGTALDELRRAGQLDRTLVVVTADHGESLGDHGETTHGLFAYDSTQRVPLLFWATRLRPRSVSSPIAHVDVMPTTLELLRLTIPASIDGRSRGADIDTGRTVRDDPIYFEALDANLTRGWAPLRGLVHGMWKYIDLPVPELYDLTTDPGERTNLVGREPDRVRDLQNRLQQWTTSPVRPGATVDSGTAERLRALGYVSGSAANRSSYATTDDPKQLVSLSEMFNEALEDSSRGHVDMATQKFSKILDARPDFLAARLSAATVNIGAGRAGDAVRLLREAPPSDQALTSWQTRMGQALAATGELRQARSLLESVIKQANGDPEPLNELGVVLVRLGELEEARRAFKQLLDLDPTAAGTWYNLGLLEMQARRPDAAAVAFARVVEITPKHADGWRGLGAAVAANDQLRATDAWRHVLELEPNDFDTLYNLAMVLAESGRHVEALPYLRRFVAEAPKNRYGNDLPRVRALLARLENQS
jgi:arylsulfatase A-like enzyme/tetratricopeptide (TPR) repeat protein